MSSKCRSFQDNFGSKNSNKLVKYRLFYGIVCQMALSGLFTEFIEPNASLEIQHELFRLHSTSNENSKQRCFPQRKNPANQ